TLWYGVYDKNHHRLRYANAGHPPALMLAGNGQPSIKLGNASVMIGVAPDAAFETADHVMTPGSRLYLYSDGVIDVAGPGDGKILGVSGLSDLLARAFPQGGSRVQQIRGEIQALQGSLTFTDDFSLLEIEFA